MYIQMFTFYSLEELRCNLKKLWYIIHMKMIFLFTKREKYYVTEQKINKI